MTDGNISWPKLVTVLAIVVMVGVMVIVAHTLTADRLNEQRMKVLQDLQEQLEAKLKTTPSDVINRLESTPADVLAEVKLLDRKVDKLQGEISEIRSLIKKPD